MHYTLVWSFIDVTWIYPAVKEWEGLSDVLLYAATSDNTMNISMLHYMCENSFSESERKII